MGYGGPAYDETFS